MILPDVNVLVYAFRRDTRDHERCRRWLEEVFGFTDHLRSHTNVISVAPGRSHWSIFRHLCSTVRARGNLTADAYLAALAIESGAEWITTDRDFARFPGLRWRSPF